MRLPSNPPPRLRAQTEPYHGYVERPGGARSWAAWVGLSLVGAIVASCGDRMVDRVFMAIDDRREPELVFVPVPTTVSPAEGMSHRAFDARPSAPSIQKATPARAVPPPGDRVVPVPLPAGPEGEAGLVAAMRAGALRPAGPSDVALWVARHSAQGGTVNGEALQSSMRDAYVVLGDFAIPGGLYGAHSVTFVVPAGVPYPSGDPGHSVVLDVASGACMGVACPGAGH